MGEAADHADQSLRPERHGPAGARISHEEHAGVLVSGWSRRGRRYDEEGHDLMVAGRGRRVAGASVLTLLCACASTQAPETTTAAPASSRWVDSALASMTVREKAGQLVWPWI